MSLQIVERINDDDAESAAQDAASDALPIEPSLFPEPRGLVPRGPGTPSQLLYLRHLERRIQRNPRDLHAHVRRTLIYRTLGDRDAGFGALIDLFLILGPRGLQLRENLLLRWEGKFPEARYRFLRARLKSGLQASEPLPRGVSSVLARGITGVTNIVEVSEDASSTFEDPVQRAQERMAKGDRAAAQAILEAAFREDPGREDVCRELIGLYRRENLPESFFTTYVEGLSRRLAVPHLWEDTERSFLGAGAPRSPDSF